jgi:DNA modification methylase
MDGVKADMLFTSPPYSDMREYNGGKDLSVSNISKFIGAYRPYTDYQCVNLGIQRKDHEIVQYWDEYIAKAKECGYKLLAWNVWDKTMAGSIGQQSAFFPIRHEWVFVFGTEFFEINETWEKKDKSIDRKSNKRKVRQPDGTTKYSTIGDTTNKYKQMESVVAICSECGKIRALHPATFPVQLPAEYIKAMTNEGDSVIEPFGGSGSTLIACEQLNRKCYMCELDPKYVDVIIDRWEKFTGQKAVKLN